MKFIHELQHNGIVWVNVSRQTEKELQEIESRFSLERADILESLPPYQRPKMAKRPGYTFLVLHFPVFDRETRRLGYTEVDFFVSQNFLITIHDNKLLPIEKMFMECKKNPLKLEKFFSVSGAHILFEILNRLLDSIFPILLHVNEDINFVDKKLFTKVSGREMSEEILRLKTNTVTFRRTMQGHKTVLDRMLVYSGRELSIPSLQGYVHSVREFLDEIWNMLGSQRETIDALHEANESFLTLRTNNIMRILTVISVITFPLTLLAAIFAIHTPSNPFTDMAGGFWIIVTMMSLMAYTMYLIFKKKDWV